MSDNIKVVVKVRPLISREVEDDLSLRWRVKNNTLWQLDPNGSLTDVSFTFDKVYDEKTKTKEVYDDVAKPIVEAAIAGFNGTIFAYGQTSSGKTYTMTGTEESPGIIPLAVLNIFKLIEQKKDRDFLVRISYIEIYNETVKDLLDVEKKNIKVHESYQGVKVDCSEIARSSPEEVLEVMKQGEVNRQTGSTNMNEESSRSHSIFQIIIESREHVDGEEECGCVNVSVLNLVDLAGSERAGQTGATGLRFKEGTHINRSLSSLALVIKQLSEDPNKYVNYRDSKLTRILQNSLGGNAKTSIICAITPASLEETHSTLQFANRAKSIKNKPEVNAVVATSSTMIQGLTKQLSKLQSELAAKQNLEVMLESSKNVEQELQNKIAKLQRLILNGFSSRRSLELAGAAGRRKAGAQRRVTISTLHHIEEEPAPAPPRFCTPGLKYNPLCMLPPSDVCGSLSSVSGPGSKLAPVPEEGRMTTPPPTERKIGCQNEIIEINSDDDSITETRCSPYHKCYGTQKTPPCILRKNAKQAEKNLKDIVELTAREKLYTPDVVEQIEKVEKYANIITQLQEEIVALKETCIEKDATIEELTDKVYSTEAQVNTITSAKSDLEVQCKEKDTKLTDLEVIYETLLKKSKTREQELLSLLAEHQQPKNRESIGNPKKMESEILNFMDMSKDMSLVNSDNESITQDDGSSQIQDLISHMQAELAAKSQTILDLETDTYTLKQQIESLDASSRQLQLTIDEFQNKLANVESENVLLKLTIDNLNSTIESQKENLESAAKDMESYNNTIQELQIQLNKKEHILNTKINDNIIDNMIANEQKCIANNDNIKNIIQSLKVIVENRNKEIECLQTTIKENKEASAEKTTLTEQIEIKENVISTLIDEADKLKQQLSENMTVLNKLIKVEQDLSNQLSTMQEENESLLQQKRESAIEIESLQKMSTESEIQIGNLQSDNEKLTRKIAEQEIKEQNMASKYQELSKQNEDMANKISKLEEDLDEKKIESESLSHTLAEKEINEQKMTITMQKLLKQVEDMTQRINDIERHLEEKDKAVAAKDSESECNLTKAKTILHRLHNIVFRLKGSTETLPESIGDLETVLKMTDSAVSHLDDSAKQNQLTIANLEDKLSLLITTKDSEISLIKTEVEQLNNELTVQTETLTHKTMSLIEELKTIRTDLELRNQEICELKEKLKNAVSVGEDKDQKTQENLNKAKSVLCTLHSIALRLNHGIEALPKTINNFDTLFESFDCNLEVLDTAVTLILKIAVDMQDKLMEFTNEKESEIANFESQIEKINCDMAVQTLKLSQQIFNLIEQLRYTRTELESKNQELSGLGKELAGSLESNANLRNDLMSKDRIIASLSTVVDKLNNMNINIDKLEEMLETKNAQIQFLQDQISNDADSLEDKYKDVTNALGEAIQNRDMLLAEIMKKATRVARQCGIDNNEIGETNVVENVYERVVLILDKIGMSVALLKTENDIERSDIERMLTVAKEEIEKLTETNVNLMNDYDNLRNNNNQLLLELERIKKVNIELLCNSEVLEQLKLELHSKSNEIKCMEAKAMEWREEFKAYDDNIKGQMRDLIAENEKLKTVKEMELKRLSVLSDHFQDLLPNSQEKPKINSPESLLTICCNKLVSTLQLYDPNVSNTSSSMTTSISKSSIQVENAETQTCDCECKKLSLELKKAMEQNLKLVEDLDTTTNENVEIMDVLKDLSITNEFLLNEREEVRKEIKMLTEPAIELQKKITNHRTNLSTLTATNYAENKLLNSQLKVLKHHHTRYIHVCQRDLPAFKTQLNELMTILKENTFVDKQNASFKRFSLPDILDSSTSTSTFKNESTLDGDLLMLSTNLTLNSVDNTLVGSDQTCLDVTQTNFDANDTASQTNDISKTVDPCLLFSQIEILTNDNRKLSDEIEKIHQENFLLREKMQTSVMPTAFYKDTQSSPIKVNGMNEDMSAATKKSLCEYCNELKTQFQNLEENLSAEIKELYKELEVMKVEKDSIQEKYTNLTLEIPSTEALVRKLSNTEKDYMAKLQEAKKLTNDLNNKNKIIKELQDENDTLSVQVMDNISEADSLKKESDELKDVNNKLLERLKHFELLTNEYETKINTETPCSLCATKDEIIKSLQIQQSKLTRTLSDSESSSRHNKICTLQNELHASKEDCRKITEEVATIKNHLERSNVSACQAMDLDESMGDSSIFVISKDMDSVEKKIQSSINFEETANAYINDKIDCIKFYVDKIGPEKEILNGDVKIIDLMSILYNNLVAKHGEEVENLLNKLKDFEESKTHLQTQLSNASSEYSKVTRELQESQNNFKTVTTTLDKIKSNIDQLNQEMTNVIEKDSKIITLFKENLLQVIDSEFGLSCVNIFNSVIDTFTNKHQQELSDIIKKYTSLENQMECAKTEFNSVYENLKQVECQLSDKEKQYNLLKDQKEKIQEISSAVTLDIVKKERELKDILTNSYEKLTELDIIDPYTIDAYLPITENLGFLFKQIINKNVSQCTEKEKLIIEINNLKTILKEKESDVSILQEKLLQSEKESQIQKTLQEELSKNYQHKIDENKILLEKIENLSQEINAVKKEMVEKEKTLVEIIGTENQDNIEEQSLPVKECVSCSELIIKLENWRQDYDNLKTINDMITKEKQSLASDLEKAQQIISMNKAELDKMTADILVLRQSVNDNVNIIQTLTHEAKSMMEQNVQLRKQFDEKCQECSRLEMNIKTHQKTAEIQTRMITRLHKQKEEDDKATKEKDKLLEELTEKCTTLQKECKQMKDDLKTAREEIDILKNRKDSLEAKVTELETELTQDGHRRRQSMEAITEASRRRRQSLHDTKRAFNDDFDENKVEAVFESRTKPDDLFMDVDENGSNRSTPTRLSRGRDSLLARHDHDDDPPSRPSSVAQIRRRRQSIHDQHRTVPRNSSPLDMLTSDVKTDNNMSSGDTNIAQLQERLAATQLELEDLKERYRELDDECETCAQYLQERDEQCRKLKKEKTTLEHQVAELNEKLKSNPNRSEVKFSFAHAAVNTDEDWANLHSVVVDRMSFDAEVEKNKKLVRTIEELRCNKLELKNTVAKMQRALEKNAAFMHSKELDAAKAELSKCKEELASLRQRYAELDEECETCAQYLRERDEQCSKLKKAKLALERELKEIQGDVGNMAAAARRKRHSVHDHNRPQAGGRADAHTQISDDFLTHQVERDDNALKSSNTQVQELQRVKMALEKVAREKAVLEGQLLSTASALPTVYVATGSAIVQNQQITDVMKENQKLKKMNAKLISICKKRGKAQDHDANRENEQPPADLG